MSVRELDTRPIVVDMGGGTIKLGVAGDTKPLSVYPCMVRCENHRFDSPDPVPTIFCDESQDDIAYLPARSPIEHGFITDWENMEGIFDHVLREKCPLDSWDRPLLISNHHTNKDDNEQSEKILQMRFETFNAPSCYVAQSTSLAAFRAAKPTCAVIDCGDSVTDICCLYEGCGITRSVKVVDIAGSEISTHIRVKVMEASGRTNTERRTAREIKEKWTYVADCPTERKETENVTIESPWEEFHLTSPDAFHCPEMLFNPRGYGFDFDGIGQTLLNSIMECDEEIRKELFSNIVLSGGTTMCPGFAGRLGAEIARLAPPNTRVNIVAPPERDLVVWRGGSMLAASDLFSEMAITRLEYDEVGKSIVHHKCW